MGLVVSTTVDDGDGDFVWDSMLDYWSGTGQLNGLDVGSSAGLSEGEFRQLGYAASYGTSFRPGIDPQAGGVASWFGSDWSATGAWLTEPVTTGPGPVEGRW